MDVGTGTLATVRVTIFGQDREYTVEELAGAARRQLEREAASGQTDYGPYGLSMTQMAALALHDERSG